MAKATVQQQLNDALRRLAAMSEGVMAQNDQMAKIQRALVQANLEKERMDAELVAAQAQVQMLGNEYNERSGVANAQIEDLRNRLKAAGLDAEVI